MNVLKPASSGYNMVHCLVFVPATKSGFDILAVVKATGTPMGSLTDEIHVAI